MPIKAEWVAFKKEIISLMHPEETGVYECARGSKVVYIGKGVLRNRLLKHTEEIRFIGVTRFRIRKIGSASETRDAEARLLHEFHKRNGKLPELNKQLPELRKRDDWSIW